MRGGPEGRAGLVQVPLELRPARERGPRGQGGGERGGVGAEALLARVQVALGGRPRRPRGGLRARVGAAGAAQAALTEPPVRAAPPGRRRAPRPPPPRLAQLGYRCGSGRAAVSSRPVRRSTTPQAPSSRYTARERSAAGQPGARGAT